MATNYIFRRVTIPMNITEEVDEWCEDNGCALEPFTYGNSSRFGACYIAHVHTPDDARTVLFKLRWSDELGGAMR